MALFGAPLGLMYDRTLFVAVLSGALLGLLGLRPLKLVFGLLVGAGVGALFGAFAAGAGQALVAATVAVVYRAIAAVAYRDRPLVRIMVEEVPAAELRYVVPFEAALALRRRRLRRAARARPGCDVPPQPARRRDPRLARQP